MKKILLGTVNYNGKPAKIEATITDANGYISITGELIPFRCRTAHVAGCIHEEIIKAFPKLKPFIWLHLANLDGSIMYEVENTLYFLANEDTEAAQKALHCSDSEILSLQAMVLNGLHRSKTSYGYKDNATGYTVTGDGVQLFAKELEKYNFTARRKAEINRFYDVLKSL